MRLIATLFLLLAAVCHAGRLPIRIYRTSQGLPRNSVTCMVGGQNGIMWFCTTEGLVRFDGYDFRVFGPEQGLPSRIVSSMTPSRAGGYWVVTGRGLCRLRVESKIGEPCHPLTSPSAGEWQGGHVVESESGEVWVSSQHHVFLLPPNGKALEDIAFPIEDSTYVLALALGGPGTVLVGTETGLFESGPGGHTRRLTDGMTKMGVGSIVRHPSGDYWLSTASGLFRMRLTGAERKPEFRGGWVDQPDYPANLLLRRDGSLWITTARSVLQLKLDPAGNASVVRRIGNSEGLPNVPMQLISEDAGGRLWVSTEAEGVLRIDDSGFTSYADGFGIGTARIASLFEDRAGRLCVITTWDGGANLRVWRDDQFRAIHIPYPKEVGPLSYGGGWDQFGLQAHDGEWWIPTDAGLLEFAAADTEALPAAPLKHWYRPGAGLNCSSIFRVFEDSHGDVWVGCDTPRPMAARWDRHTRRFHEYAAADGWPPEQTPSVFREATDGTLWIGTDSGVARFRNGRFEVVRLGPPGEGFVRDLFIDSKQRVWIAVPGKGLFRCDQPDAEHPVFINYTERDGLASLFLRAVTQDRQGLIYVSSVRGVDRIDPEAPHVIRHFTSDDGLPDSEHNVAFATHDGHLWFGTLHGLAEYDPARSSAPSPPGVYFTRLLVRGEDVAGGWEGVRHAQLSLAPNRNQLQIEFAGSDSHSLSALRYEYRLNESEWSAPTAQRSVNYPALPSGHLAFEVRATNSDGQTSPETATIDLTVAAPLWQRGWFLLLLTLAIGAAGTAAYRYRVGQLLELERLRTRIAIDLHDDIGANLSQISILSEVLRRDPGHSSLDVIPEIARETVEQMNDIVWAINPRHDRIDSLLHRMRRYAGDTLGGAGIELDFESENLPPDLRTPIEARRPLYLVFKEAVNNAARHSHASRVTIRMELSHGLLKMTIADDGRGFDPTASREGEGVNSIGRRMRDMGGAAVWDAGPGRGARLTATLPLKQVGTRARRPPL